MKIVVVGAAGNLGSRTVDAALAAGHEVVAYVRRPEAVRSRAGLSVVQGAAEDSDALARAAAGADVVILSITGSPKDATFMQRTLPPVLDAVTKARAGRLVLVSAFGAGDTADKASGLARFVYRRVLGTFFADKAASDALLTAANVDVDWTIVYPVNLKDAGPLPGGATVKRLQDVGRVPGLPTLSFADAGQALVRIAEDPSLSGARVVVTTPKGSRPA